MEYQYYDFRAVDRPLDEAAQRALRKWSSRADITDRSLTNTYNFGSFRGDPEALVEKYFDAHVYVANWGTRRLAFRFPKGRIDVKPLRPYCDGNVISLRTRGSFVILDLSIEDEESRDVVWEGSEWMPKLLGLRDELMAGDLRALYLAWLLVVELGEIDQDDVEPPVPAGLDSLTPPQQSLVEFLWLDGHLIEAAAKKSPKRPAIRRPKIHAFIQSMTAREKDQILARLVGGEEAAGRELSQRFVRTHAIPPAKGTRTVQELLDAAKALRSPRRPKIRK